MPYNKEELDITNAIANNQLESVPFDNDTIKSDAKHTLEYLKQKKLISIKKHALDILNSALDVEPCESDKISSFQN